MSVREVNGLTPQQEDAISALLQYPTMKKAAEAVTHHGPSEQALRHALGDEPVDQAVRRDQARADFLKVLDRQGDGPSHLG